MQIDFTNQMRAAAQHTSPNVQAHAKDLLGNVVQDEADNFFYTDAQGNLTPLNEQDHVILQDRDGQLKAYNRTEKTQEGMLAGLGRFIISGSGRARSPRRQCAFRLEWRPYAGDLGIDVPSAISTGSPTKQFVGQALSKMPGGGELHQNIEHRPSSSLAKPRRKQSRAAAARRMPTSLQRLVPPGHRHRV